MDIKIARVFFRLVVLTIADHLNQRGAFDRMKPVVDPSDFDPAASVAGWQWINRKPPAAVAPRLEI